MTRNTLLASFAGAAALALSAFSAQALPTVAKFDGAANASTNLIAKANFRHWRWHRHHRRHHRHHRHHRHW